MGSAPPGVQAARLDLAEHQVAPSNADDVELAPPGPVVALDDLESAPAQVVGGELLAELPEAMAGVVAHALDARDRPCDTWLARCANSQQGDAAGLRRVGTDA